MKIVTEEHTESGTNVKSLSDLHHDAVVLVGLTETIAFLENEGGWVDGRIALVGVVGELTRQLADDMDLADTAQRRAVS